MSIKVLDPKVVAQIAAGEVVERPASVVKELVENALDAGATQISVEVRRGGVGLIRVIDDGFGIPPDEVEVAFQRHATSKIAGIEGLSQLSTLGFRGEALPSIATVSEVEIVTCAEIDSKGTLLRLEGGSVAERGRRGRSRGTTITVRNLFSQVPARLKFLKSDATENKHISDVVTQYSLSFPEVRFILIIDGREALRTPGSGRVLDSLIAVYGIDTASGMMEVGGGEKDWEDGTVSEIEVDGMVGSPSVTRSNRNDISFFVNRRWVKNRLLSWALEEAYHGLLMTERHPVAVINIAISPARVDANIHPTKSEVKFQDERSVFVAVQKAVRRALLSLSTVPDMEEKAVPYGRSKPAYQQQQGQWFSVEEQAAPRSPAIAPTPMVALPMLRVLGQVASEYIVGEGPDGLYVIDQHAAHERVVYERIRQQRSVKGVEVQGLLEPVTLEVSPPQDAIMKSRYRELAEFGFEIEEFGDRTYLVRAVPSVLSGRDWQAVLRDTLEAQDGKGGGNWQEKLYILMSCHGAVRAGQTLADQEMRELVSLLSRTVLPHTCPHGRPTIMQLSLEKLARDFRRV